MNIHHVALVRVVLPITYGLWTRIICWRCYGIRYSISLVPATSVYCNRTMIEGNQLSTIPQSYKNNYFSIYRAAIKTNSLCSYSPSSILPCNSEFFCGAEAWRWPKNVGHYRDSIAESLPVHIGIHLSPMDRILDTQFWKRYLSVNT